MGTVITISFHYHPGHGIFPKAFYTAGFFQSFPSIFMQHTALQAVLRHLFEAWMSISDPEEFCRGKFRPKSQL